MDGSSLVPSSPAATSSSSAKNAFPPDRAWIDSRSASVEVSTRDRPELLDRLAMREREELDAFDAPASLELGDERQQRVAAVELVGAVGEQQHDRAVAQVADQEAEQVTGRPIGPVKVLDDEQQRAPLGDPGQDPEQELEQATLRRPDAQR